MMDFYMENFDYFAEPTPIHEDYLAVQRNWTSMQQTLSRGVDSMMEPRLKRRSCTSRVDRSNPCEFSPFYLSNASDLMPNPEGCACWNQQSHVCSIAPSAAASSTGAMPLYSNPLDDPRPLGLSLRKSPSLLDLIQKNLDQDDKAAVSEQGIEENTKAKGTARVDSQQDKLKASNFPASHLKIGQWEISKAPLFFREINPQPRKHTIWQPTPDFTSGQASICCRHHLQFSEGVLNRHFDKLLQCDQRLKDLSEQSMPFSRSPFFECGTLMPAIHQHSQFPYTSDISSIRSLSSLKNEVSMPFDHGDIIAKQNNVFVIENPGKRGSAEAQPFSPSSVMDSRANDESSNSDIEDLGAKDFTRHAGYNEKGTTMLFHQRFPYGDRLVASTSGLSPHAVGSNSMWSRRTPPECRASGSQVLLAENDASSCDKNFLEEFSHHLLEDTLHENILPNGQMSGQFTQQMETNIRQQQVSPCFPSQHNRIVNAVTYCPSNRPYLLSLDQNLGMPLAVKEAGKSCELPHKSVKIENYVSSQLDHKDFFLSGDTHLGRGGPGILSHSSFQDSWGLPQVGSLPDFFE